MKEHTLDNLEILLLDFYPREFFELVSKGVDSNLFLRRQHSEKNYLSFIGEWTNCGLFMLAYQLR